MAGTNFHNVNFTGPQPTSCVQTAGTVGGAVPPMPTNPTPAGWAGNCRFDTPDTYDFVCDAHPQMVGTVVVEPATSTPTPIPSTTATPTPTSTPTPTPGPAADQLKLARNQRGQAVKGSIAVARAGSRLSVRVLAKPSALRRSGRARVRVGSVTRTANAGTARFTVTLSRAARRALARRGRLALTIRITVTPPNGTPFSAKKPVTLNR